MSTQLTAEDAKQSLSAHVEAKGAEIHQKYGPHFGWEQVQILLQDRTCVRYPCDLVFDAAPLMPGEFAFPVPKGARPEDGFTMHIHPVFQSRLDEVPLLVLYQLVVVNYGEFASNEDAERFGAAALGLDQESYYRALCRLADSLPQA